GHRQHMLAGMFESGEQVKHRVEPFAAELDYHNHRPTCAGQSREDLIGEANLANDVVAPREFVPQGLSPTPGSLANNPPERGGAAHVSLPTCRPRSDSRYPSATG